MEFDFIEKIHPKDIKEYEENLKKDDSEILDNIYYILHNFTSKLIFTNMGLMPGFIWNSKFDDEYLDEFRKVFPNIEVVIYHHPKEHVTLYYDDLLDSDSDDDSCNISCLFEERRSVDRVIPESVDVLYYNKKYALNCPSFDDAYDFTMNEENIFRIKDGEVGYFEGFEYIAYFWINTSTRAGNAIGVIDQVYFKEEDFGKVTGLFVRLGNILKRETSFVLEMQIAGANE